MSSDLPAASRQGSSPVAVRPTIRYRPGVPRPVPRTAAPQRIDAEARAHIIDTWPGAIAVSVKEVEVIETFLGDLLGEILRDPKPGQPSPKPKQPDAHRAETRRSQGAGGCAKASSEGAGNGAPGADH